MKRVLVVGAGIGQFYLAKKVKERGDFLISVTLPGNQPVISIADEVIFENVFDKESVLKKAIAAGVEAVVSDQNDTMMPTVAYVAEHMGLPGNCTAIVNAYCNKNVFRDNCDRLGIPTPKHTAVHRSDGCCSVSLSCPFPWMVKPADSQSSLGISKVNDASALEEALNHAFEFSRTASAIVEEYFEGEELVAEGFIYKGQYFNLGFADRKYFALDGVFIPSQTLFPSIAPKHIKESVSADFAIVHSEYLYNIDSGEIRVVESALRGGGVYISSHLIPLYSGIDINDVLLDCAMGEQIQLKNIFSKKLEKAAGYVCFYLPEGQIVSISGMDKILKCPGVEMVDIRGVKVGMSTSPMAHKGQRLGPILVSADNRMEMDSIIKRVQYILNIQVITRDGFFMGIKWT